MDPSEPVPTVHTTGPRLKARGFVELVFVEKEFFIPTNRSLIALTSIKSVTEVQNTRNVCQIIIAHSNEKPARGFVQGNYETIYREIAEASNG